MNSELARNILSILIAKSYDIDLRILHVRLSRETPSKEVIRQLEHTLKDFEVLWAATRPGFTLSRFHVLCVFYHTLKAFALGKNISNKFNIEFLLRLTCEDQITNALRVAGLDVKVREFCLYVLSTCKEALERSLLFLHFPPFEDIKQVSDLEQYESRHLLELLKVDLEELSATDYKSSILDSKLKSALTRMSLLNVKR
ncbi:MAG: KEOPS complex subunit Cgi121 [Candidatus Nezhaarchaeota archaeon]|nr:KEOPS complex subunit Cgi121 [Candidatus Nezhaarchaeota archaeon]